MAARFLVISIQRSGLNWLRHCEEFFSGMRTPGRPQLIAKGPVLFERAHDVRRQAKISEYAGLYDGDGAEIYERVALLLRNPLDCFTSHYLGRADVKFREGLRKFEAYAVNIIAFDKLKHARKAVFHFDDFVNNEAGTFDFLRFFEVAPKSRPCDFADLTESSRAWYRKTHGLFETRERPQLNAKQRCAIMRMLHEKLGDKFEFYLGRYALDQ